MKIGYLLPGTLISLDEVKRREAVLNKWAYPGTEIDFITFDEGPSTIESRYEETISIPLLAKKTVQLESEGYDAVIIGCAEDPGLEVLRELTTRMVVIGPGRTSLLIAASLGSRFSAISTNTFNIQKWYELAYKAGVSDKLCSVRPLGLTVADFCQNNRQKIISKLIPIIEREKSDNYVDVIVLGCLSLGYLDITEDIASATGICIINTPHTVVKYTEALVSCGLTHSKIAYPLPLRIQNGPPGMNLDQLFVTRMR